MKPTEKIASARTPDGCEMLLYKHDLDYSIKINGYELMNSRQHESELELARLGCASLTDKEKTEVLIGGLGLGYTLRQSLDMLTPGSKVTVAELLEPVVEWNREFTGELNGYPLRDKRVLIKTGDVVALISRARGRYDAILLDVDNGPSALTDAGNARLYGREGIKACRRALRKHGCLAIWSAEPNRPFEQRLMSCGFKVRRYRASSYKGSKSQSRFIWVASEDSNVLPEGGGEPRKPAR